MVRSSTGGRSLQAEYSGGRTEGSNKPCTQSLLYSFKACTLGAGHSNYHEPLKHKTLATGQQGAVVDKLNSRAPRASAGRMAVKQGTVLIDK
jgi:hypothetical protein